MTRFTMLTPLTPLTLLTALTGCFETIAHEAPDAAPEPDATLGGKYTTTRGNDGTYTTVVDSTSATEWTYGDFASGKETSATEPWDLRFQRFHISTNGGVSGAGGVEVVPVVGVPFAQVTSPPAMGWRSDAADGDDPDTDPEYAFEQDAGWYDYDPTTHVVTPKALVWIVKTRGGAMIKVQIEKYYDDAGTAGWLSLRWRPL